MNAQIFITLIAVVSVIRFIKGRATRKREFNFETEVNGFFTHTTVVFGVYGITYLIVSLF
jgi:hypothetical protein